MEQGRRRPSPSVVDALAAALRLNPDEHGHLRALAGFAAPAARTGLVPREMTPAASRMLERMTEVPACVCDATWSVLAGNKRWVSHACPAGAAHGRDRNMAWRVFTEAPTDVFRTPEHLAAVPGVHGRRPARRRAPLSRRSAAAVPAHAERMGRRARVVAEQHDLTRTVAAFEQLYSIRPVRSAPSLAGAAA